MSSTSEIASLFLKNLASALKKRSKALKSKFPVIDISEECSKHENLSDSISVTFRTGRSHKAARISVKAWEDRWIMIDAREASKSGWKWEFELQGRLSGAATPTEFIFYLEEFESMLWDSNLSRSDLAEYWRNKLLTGPSPLVSQPKS